MCSELFKWHFTFVFEVVGLSLNLDCVTFIATLIVYTHRALCRILRGIAMLLKVVRGKHLGSLLGQIFFSIFDCLFLLKHFLFSCLLGVQFWPWPTCIRWLLWCTSILSFIMLWFWAACLHHCLDWLAQVLFNSIFSHISWLCRRFLVSWGFLLLIIGLYLERVIETSIVRGKSLFKNSVANFLDLNWLAFEVCGDLLCAICKLAIPGRCSFTLFLKRPYFIKWHVFCVYCHLSRLFL